MSALIVYLQKDKGDIRMWRHRPIQLYEADFNFNNKTTGRKCMINGEKHNLLAPEQYDGRKFHRAIHQALNCKLINDVIRQEKITGIVCSTDAKSNYNRVVHQIVYMALQRLGIPQNATRGMLQTFQKMRHRVRTIYGNSDSFTTSINEMIDFQGIGQGNGSATAIWAAISTVIINVLKAQGYGIKLVSAISKTILNILILAFVDDTNLFTIGSPL